MYTSQTYIPHIKKDTFRRAKDSNTQKATDLEDPILS